MSVSVQGMELNKVLDFLLSVTQSIRLVYNIAFKLIVLISIAWGCTPALLYLEVLQKICLPHIYVVVISFAVKHMKK